MSFNFGKDLKNDHDVHVRELYWYLLNDEAELGGVSVEAALNRILEDHFMRNTCYGRGYSADQIGLTMYFDIDELIGGEDDNDLHF